MIFGWDCVSCDDSAIATIRSPLQTSIHRQTVNLWPLSIRRGMLLGALILSAGGQFVAFICRGRGAFGSPYEDNDFGSLISSSMVVERNQDLKVMNLDHMLYPMMQLPIFFY